MYINPNILRGPPVTNDERRWTKDVEEWEKQLRVIFEGHELYYLLGKDEKETRQLTLQYLVKNNLLESHIEFLENNKKGDASIFSSLELIEPFFGQAPPPLNQPSLQNLNQSNNQQPQRSCGFHNWLRGLFGRHTIFLILIVGLSLFLTGCYDAGITTQVSALISQIFTLVLCHPIISIFAFFFVIWMFVRIRKRQIIKLLASKLGYDRVNNIQWADVDIGDLRKKIKETQRNYGDFEVFFKEAERSWEDYDVHEVDIYVSGGGCWKEKSPQRLEIIPLLQNVQEEKAKYSSLVNQNNSAMNFYRSLKDRIREIDTISEAQQGTYPDGSARIRFEFGVRRVVSSPIIRVFKRLKYKLVKLFSELGSIREKNVNLAKVELDKTEYIQDIYASMKNLRELEETLKEIDQKKHTIPIIVLKSAIIKMKLALLERMARKEIPDENVENIIKDLVELGTERSEIQKSLILYNRLRGRYIPCLLSNYHLNGIPVEFRLRNQVEFVFEEDGVLEELFRNKIVMAIETHPDDIMIEIGYLTRRIITLSERTIFVTALPDQAGVTDEYVKNLGKTELPKNIDFRDKTSVKRWVRTQEAKLGAELLGVETKNYVNLDLDLPLVSPRYDKTGRLLSFESVFKAPTFKDVEKIESLVKKYFNVEVYLLVFPFSNHPHHREVTKMFLNSIYRCNRNAQIIFWEDDSEVKQHFLPPNFFYFYGDEKQKQKESNIRKAYDSQNGRRGGEFYIRQAETTALNTVEVGYALLRNRREYSRSKIATLRKKFAYAERMLMVDIVKRDLPMGGKFRGKFRGHTPNSYSATMPVTDKPDREPLKKEFQTIINAFGGKEALARKGVVLNNDNTIISPSLAAPAEVRGGVLYINPNI
ncbi:MAG: hypothetical protein ABIH71_07655, partial [Candidatus Omnitrophota bacterium]